VRDRRLRAAGASRDAHRSDRRAVRINTAALYNPRVAAPATFEPLRALDQPGVDVVGLEPARVTALKPRTPEGFDGVIEKFQ
jgi:hypothetical protein